MDVTARGLSAGAVAGARSNLGQNAISSKARKVERQRVEQAALERRGGSVADSLGAGMAATEATAYGYPAMHGGMFSGGIAGQAMGAGGGMNGLAGNASKISSTLAMESYPGQLVTIEGDPVPSWAKNKSVTEYAKVRRVRSLMARDQFRHLHMHMHRDQYRHNR